MLRAMIVLANQQPLGLLVIVFVEMVIGFSLSLILSVIYRQLINRRAIVTWGVTALAAMTSRPNAATFRTLLNRRIPAARLRPAFGWFVLERHY